MVHIVEADEEATILLRVKNTVFGTVVVACQEKLDGVAISQPIGLRKILLPPFKLCL